MRRIAALAALVGTLVVSTAAGHAAGVTPCNGTKIDPVASGTYTVPFGTSTGSITITVRQTSAGSVFDFQTDSPSDLVTSVDVKGGPVAPVTTTYSPGTTSGTDLHSAPNPNSGKWYGLSYVCFTTTSDGGPL